MRRLPRDYGAQTWQLQERSTAGGVFTNLGAARRRSRSTPRTAPGRWTASINNVSASQTGRTITFTYTAAAGATVGRCGHGDVHPRAGARRRPTATAAGYASASTGTVSAAGQTITVSGVTLAAGGTMTIVYGDTGGGGGGATASATTGAQIWQAQRAIDARGRARESCGVALDHGVRRRRRRHGRIVDLGRLGEPDRTHRHAHVHRSDRRHAERLAHRRRAVRVDASRHRRRAPASRRRRSERCPSPGRRSR